MRKQDERRSGYAVAWGYCGCVVSYLCLLCISVLYFVCKYVSVMNTCDSWIVKFAVDMMPVNSIVRSWFLTLRRLMPYIYMEHPFLMFLDHTQRRRTVGSIPLDEWSARRRDLYLTTHDTHNRQIPMPPVGFEPKISAGERPYHTTNYSFPSQTPPLKFSYYNFLFSTRPSKLCYISRPFHPPW